MTADRDIARLLDAWLADGPMRVSDRAQAGGAVIGKALRPLDSGTGLIPVMVTMK